MRRSRISWVPVLLVLITACGGSSFTEKAHSSLGTALVATNAARDEFLAWDKAHQLELVDAAPTAEAAKASLAAYRAKRAPVLHAFTVAYTAIGAAAAYIPLVDKGIKKESDLLPLLADVATAAIATRDAYLAIRGQE